LSDWWGKEELVENVERIGSDREKESRIGSRVETRNAW